VGVRLSVVVVMVVEGDEGVVVVGFDYGVVVVVSFDDGDVVVSFDDVVVVVVSFDDVVIIDERLIVVRVVVVVGVQCFSFISLINDVSWMLQDVIV